MTSPPSINSLPADEVAHFKAALAVANIPTLVPLLVQLTGDERWLEDPYRPRRGAGLGDNTDGGLPEAVQEEIRAAALDAILAWRAGAPIAVTDPPHDLLVRMLSVAMGEPVPAQYGPMLAAEVAAALTPEDPERLDVPDGFSVLIVGAGVSGLAAGINLQAAGIPFTVLEQHDTVGGTWLENRYPGCGVDTPSALYSFSFKAYDWSRYFCLRDELFEYLQDLADDSGMREHIRFNTEVLSAAYDEAGQRWEVTARLPDGSEETLSANVLITAVGAFNKPKWPSIPGLEDFEGPTAHTARWPDDLDLTGKRVAVIGNGASSMQLVPAIAEEAGSVTIFQRSPQWAAPFELFQTKVPEPARFLTREVPLYRLWYRLRAGWTFNDRVHDALQKDPDWPHPERATSKANDGHRKFFTRYIEQELEGRPDLIEKALPDYPPFGKRILLDNGWYRSLRRDDVELVTDPIAEIRSDRVVTATGAEYEADVVICATGFDVVRFLAPMEIRGRSGRTLRETWDDDDAAAYLGIAVPDFPNLFTIYGPNSQGGHGGSLIGTAEAQLNYVMDLLRTMVREDLGALEVRPEVYEDYVRRVDEAHEKMIWTHPGMSTYYRNSRGRVVVNIPWRVVDYWHMTRAADMSEWIVEPAGAPASAAGLGSPRTG